MHCPWSRRFVRRQLVAAVPSAAAPPASFAQLRLPGARANAPRARAGTSDWLARVLALKAEGGPAARASGPMFPNNPFAHLRRAVLPAGLAAQALT